MAFGSVFQWFINDRQRDMAEYYALWVHQIKTPIAALKLLIEQDLSFDELVENNGFLFNTAKNNRNYFGLKG